MNAFTSHAIAVLIGGVFVAVGCWWNSNKPSLPSIKATPAIELKGEKKTSLECKKVLIYRDRVATELGIPKIAGHVTASANIPASDHTQTATATYSEATGETSLYIRKDPLPWLARENRWQFNLLYGYNEFGVTALRGTGLYDLIQAKRLHLGGGVSLETGGRALVGVSVTFR